MRAGLVFLWAAVAALVLFLIGVFATLVITDRIGGSAPAPAPTPSVTASAGVIDTSYGVLVLNAGPDEAQTQVVLDAVVQAGWAKDAVWTVDADEHDFVTTTVFYATEADEAAARGLADALGVSAIAQSDAYVDHADPTAKQLTVVIGLSATPAR